MAMKTPMRKASLTPHTIEKHGENYYLLMKEDQYIKDPDGGAFDEPVINDYREVIKITPNGVRQLDGKETQTIAGFEYFLQDIDGDVS